MGRAIVVRTDYTSGDVRRVAQRVKNAAQARRLLAIAAVLDGNSRDQALEAFRDCMMSGVAEPPWRSRFYSASRKIRNKSIASFQACTRHDPLYPQLLISPRRSEPPLLALT